MSDRSRQLLFAKDQYALEAGAFRRGIEPYRLMQSAAAAAFSHLRALWPEARRIHIYCGRGNNGGDGYELATLAMRAGFDVRVMAPLGEPNREPAISAFRSWREAGGRALSGDDAAAPCDLIVDALLGIGQVDAPAGALVDSIARIQAARAPVLALDVPTGLDGDRGSVAGDCVVADATVSFIAFKPGLFTGRGPDVCGRRLLADLGLDAPLWPRSDCVLLAASDWRAAVPQRRPAAHKGEAGHVLVVGGGVGMGGAAILCAEAALRAGAGRVSLATIQAHVAPVLARRPEIMVHAVDEPRHIDELLTRVDVVALGPGLGQGDWSRAIASRVLASGRTLVMDADALNLLAAGRIPVPPAETVLTPHPGEAARLLAGSVAEIERDRLDSARRLALRYGAVAVLKGAGTVIDSATQRAICALGNPGMASAGMGDALTGIIAALRAQGLDPYRAATTGVAWHAAAADRLALSAGAGFLAADLIDSLRATRHAY